MIHTEVMVAIVAAIGGVSGAVFTAWANRRRSTAESDKVIVESATDVVTLMREQITQMRQDFEDIRARVSALEAEVGAWKAWSNRVLDLVDRSISMLDPQARHEISAEAERVKRQRPGHIL